MAYQVLYRTYRPSCFKEVVGQDYIVKTLKNAIETNKIAHAYLFAGPRGTGKTSVAKLFGKAINCDHFKDEACDNCPNCKAIPEEALMSAFVESYNIMTRDHKDVMDEFLARVESTLSDSDVSKRIEKEKDKLKDISYKLNNLLDMHLEGKIDFETFEKKRDTLQNQLSEKKIEIAALEDIGNSKLDLEDRIAFMREKLETETTIKEFDRQVFESIVDYVIVGGYNEEGNADPSMITFVYRTGFKDRKDANHFKPERLNASKKKNGSGSHNKEVCQSDDTSSNSSSCHSGLQSLTPDDSNILQSNTSPDACGDGR